MITLFVLGLLVPGAAIGVGVVLWMRSLRSTWTSIWERVAKEQALTYGGPSTWGAPASAALVGERGARLAVINSHVDRDSHQLSVLLDPAPTGTLTLTLEREGLSSLVERVCGARELRTDDARFDDRFYIHTNSAGVAKQVLTREVRNAILQAEADVVQIEKGSILIRHERLGRLRGRPPERVPELCDLALRASETIAAQLERTAAVRDAKATRRAEQTPTKRPAIAEWAPALLTIGLCLLLAFGWSGLKSSLSSSRARPGVARSDDRLAVMHSNQVVRGAISLAHTRALQAKHRIKIHEGLHLPELERLQQDHEQRIAQSDREEVEELRVAYEYLRTRTEDEVALREQLTQRALEQARSFGGGSLEPVQPEQVQQVLSEVWGPR